MPTPAPTRITHKSAPRYSVVGDIYSFILTGEETAGAFMLIDALVFPRGGPPPHSHSREDETFVIVEGEITFTASGKTFTAGPGETIHLPRNLPHTFTNATDKVARTLIHCAPAGIENMFREIGDPLTPADTTPTPVTPELIQKILETCPRYGITIHPPA